MKDLKKVILENQDIRDNIKEIVLGNLEMGSVGSLDFDADHIADDLMPYVMKTILEERKKTLEEVEKVGCLRCNKLDKKNALKQKEKYSLDVAYRRRAITRVKKYQAKLKLLKV